VGGSKERKSEREREREREREEEEREGERDLCNPDDDGALNSPSIVPLTYLEVEKGDAPHGEYTRGVKWPHFAARRATDVAYIASSRSRVLDTRASSEVYLQSATFASDALRQ